MAENKTKETSENVLAFINAVPDLQKRQDSFDLITWMEEITGSPAIMWGPSIIGFGKYHYKYASGHEGDAPLLGFSPRKAAISLYIYNCEGEETALLSKLGKFKMGKACIYVQKIADINIAVLEDMCKATIAYLNEHHECACREK